MLELLERQQRLTVNQWKIISAAILGDMLDFFDFFLIGYVLAFIVGVGARRCAQRTADRNRRRDEPAHPTALGGRHEFLHQR